MTRWHARYAWLGRVATDVLLEVDDGRLGAVTEGVDAPSDATRLPGFTMPGFVNAHSHAFHRALRGRTQRDAGDFWAWRDEMYRVAAVLDPDTYRDLARATYAEMALAGITAVGEFHYLHHDRDGTAYSDPNAMGAALVDAAAAAGIRLTLLDTCYLHAGVRREPLQGIQLRFGDGDVDAWAERAGALPDDGIVVGAAIHSVRAVDPDSMSAVAAWAAGRAAPLHIHLSEQRGENDACMDATGMTPAELAAARGVLGPRTTAVHATHVTPLDVELIGRSRTRVCLCPTTERDLADGVGPGSALKEAGCSLCIGTDSHAVIDALEEARAIELDERLVTGRRGLHPPGELIAAMTECGAASIGWDAGRLEPGALADFVTIGLDGPRLAGLSSDHLASGIVFAATAADVHTVVVGGRTIVDGGRHALVDDVPGALGAAIERLDAE